MKAARKQAFNRHSAESQSRNGAYAAISICWKEIGGGDRDERLSWIGEYLGVKDLESMTDLTDDQLFAVAGEMKRLTGVSSPKPKVQRPKAHAPTSGNVVAFPGGQSPKAKVQSPKPEEVSFAASHEMVYTLRKLEEYLGWKPMDMAAFLKKRFKTTNFTMLRYRKAHDCVHALLMIAAHRDLKKGNGGEPVSRAAIAKYIPQLKRELGIDQAKK